MHNIIMPQA